MPPMNPKERNAWSLPAGSLLFRLLLFFFRLISTTHASSMPWSVAGAANRGGREPTGSLHTGPRPNWTYNRKTADWNRPPWL